MPLSTNGMNLLLDQTLRASPTDLSASLYASLHDGYLGLTGANEVTGGTYARVAMTFGAASGGSADSSSTPQLNVPAGTTVQFIGLWTALTGGTFIGYQAVGGADIAIVETDFANNELDLENGHGLSVDDSVVLIGGSAPTGLTEGTIYDVESVSTNTITLKPEGGGSALTFTANAGAGCVLSQITKEVYGGAGTFTVSDFDLSLGNKDVAEA